MKSLLSSLYRTTQFKLIVLIMFLPLSTFGVSCLTVFSDDIGFKKLLSLRVSAPKEFVPTRINDMGNVILYRGDLRNLEYDGILSDAFKKKNTVRLREAIETINHGSHHEISELILSHSDPERPSPFVRASLIPALAQVNAKGLLHRKLDREQQTIYRIEVSSDRVIQVPLPQSQSGLKYVVLILGMVTPAEITAVKVSNRKEESELVYTDEKGELVEANFLSDFLKNQENVQNPRDPTNWMWLKHKAYYY